MLTQGKTRWNLEKLIPRLPALHLGKGLMLFIGILMLSTVPAVFAAAPSETAIVEQSAAKDNARFISQDVPTTLHPGETVGVSITFKNNGTTTWIRAGGYKLGTQNPENNKLWMGAKRVRLTAPEAIAPGQSKTFVFTITAPNELGTYDFQWRMVQGVDQWFGKASANLRIKVQGSDNSARFISQSVPTMLEPGETAEVSITFKNNGSTTWTRAGGYKLGTQNPENNKLWIGAKRVRLTAPEAIAPGQSKTFTFEITAPEDPGTYNFQWRMVQGVKQWFGKSSANIRIKVQASTNAAKFVSQSVPSSLMPGETAQVSITFRNSGSTNWTRAAKYKLGSQNPQNNLLWTGSRRVLLSASDSIAPGQSKTFTFEISAPNQPGTYNFQWRMVKRQHWFGEFAPNLVIHVKSGSGEDHPNDSFGVVAAPGLAYDSQRSDQIQSLGVGWVRVSYPWPDMEPQRGAIDWVTAEKAVSALEQRGLNIYWDFSYAPGWANGRGGNTDDDRAYPPLSQQDLYDFVFAVVTRFKGRVDAWGTWNEPNLDQFYKGSIDRYLANELETTLNAIQDADPNAVIVVGELSSSPGTDPNPLNWLQQILQRAEGRFDIISHHVYDGGDTCSGRTALMDTLRSRLTQWGLSNIPVWVTETGLSQSESLKTAYLTCFYDAMDARPWWEVTFWYRFEYEAGSRWSLVNSNGQPNSTYFAYQNYIRESSSTPIHPDPPSPTPTPPPWPTN